ncbi:hypothetical protein AS4_28230 [Acinetobacter guillouiae]|uniref:hypothetical protein n=1 Tax=Acinetobacter guillouiae TaxID=106649 RepID=UPI0004EF62F8|nr:hypothetical protein [Acinetobacter guillouiae]BAP37763.1 hypothetical protein AS4_28230 [Acinetobacter guillouiae]
MSDIFFNYNGNKWEVFCERMMRHHYTQQYFTSVPANDRGDCGLEFFTRDGSIFQCYFPDPTYSMSDYKTHVQTKIRTDLKKLKKYENQIQEFLDDIIIQQWVLLIPENKTKDLIKYCNTKKRETIKADISFIDKENFTVKIETADSYPSSKKFALKYSDELIHIDSNLNIQNSISSFKDSIFEKNIKRKSSFISRKPDVFSRNMTEKYLNISNYLEKLRFSFPDTYQEIEECGRMLLSKMQDMIEIEELEPNINFIQAVKSQNEFEIDKLFGEIISNFNKNELPYGFISKWIAECNMDFYDEQ